MGGGGGWHSLESNIGSVGTGQHTVRVHLHHDHRDSLVADPDDPGTSLSLSALWIGRGSLWGVGLSLTWLIRLGGRRWGGSLSLGAARHGGPQVHLGHTGSFQQAAIAYTGRQEFYQKYTEQTAALVFYITLTSVKSCHDVLGPLNMLKTASNSDAA